MADAEKKIDIHSKKTSFLDKTIDFIFSNDERKWLALIVIFGFIFRLINTNTRVVFGDPPHFLVNAINFLNSGLLVLWDQSTFLWHALTDIFYKIFGITQFAGRFSSLLFGTFGIIAIYLFTKEFTKNKKVALIASFIYAFAPGFIFHSADEHDISVLFFIIVTFYCLVKGLNANSKIYLLLSGVFFGVTCMWKAYTPLLIMPYAGFIIYYHLTKRWNILKNYKILMIIGLIMLIAVTPTLVYNYSNYKHNEVTTFFFVKFFGFLSNEKTDSLYGWVSGGELYRNTTTLYEMFINGATNRQTGNYNAPIIYSGFVNSLMPNGRILALAGVLGIIFMIYLAFKKKDRFSKDYLVFYALYFIIPFMILLPSNTLTKHYVHFLAFMIPIVAYCLFYIYNFAKENISALKIFENHPYICFAGILIFLFFVPLSLNFNGDLLLSGNPEGKFMNYKIDNIPINSLVVYDDRIYNSLATWLLNDRHFIPVSLFGEVIRANAASQYKERAPLYLVECGIDDCGWGTIKDNPSLNKSMESFFEDIKNKSIEKVQNIPEKIKGDYYNLLLSKKKKQNDYFIIYKTEIDIDTRLLKETDKLHGSFMYPLRYENKNDAIFKNFIYTPSGFFETSLNKFAWLIFYLEILISLLAVFFILYESIEK